MQIIDCPSSLAVQVLGFRPEGINRVLHNNISNFSNVIVDKSQAAAAFNRLKDVTTGSVYRAVQAVKNRYRKVFKVHNSFKSLSSLEDLQVAPKIMINNIMSNPLLKEYYNDGIIEGYGNNYESRYSDKRGADDPYYRQSTDGMVISDNGKLICRKFYDQSGLRKLDMIEKISIIDAWSNAIRWIEEGYDPTSEDNNALG